MPSSDELELLEELDSALEDPELLDGKPELSEESLLEAQLAIVRSINADNGNMNFLIILFESCETHSFNNVLLGEYID